MLLSHDHGSFFEICYLKRGTQNYYIGNEEYTLHGGDVFITFPKEKHSTGGDPQSRGCLYWMQIDCNCQNLLGLDASSSELVIKKLFNIEKRKFKIKEEVASKLIKAYSLVDKGDEIGLIEAKALLTVFICNLIESENSAGKDIEISEAIINAKSFIDENIKEKISLSEVAERVNFSLSHFKSKFKKEIGVPPGEYILQRKIYDSMSLLSEKSLTYIAYEFNFSSPQHYSKNFKAITGMSPKQYKSTLKTDNITQSN